MVSDIAARGIEADEPAAAPDPSEPRTRWVTDPDGHRIELVQWPAGHPEGMSAADWPEPDTSTRGETR
jgi:lactoylglutathione lyase